MEQLSQCYIFSAGEFYGLQNRPKPTDFVIAADGGYRYCEAENIMPNLLLGDFDSLKKLPEEIPILTFPAEKDDTDTMLAIKTGLELGYLEFHLHGCTGGRLDHTLANFQALIYLAKKGARGFLYGATETYTAIENGGLTLPAKPNGVFSVFCFGSDATGVSIQGAKFPLRDATLTASFPLGVSNHFMEQPVRVQVRSGCLLIGWSSS
jgi:thiamine pyrophosphokinase